MPSPAPSTNPPWQSLPLPSETGCLPARSLALTKVTLAGSAGATWASCQPPGPASICVSSRLPACRSACVACLLLARLCVTSLRAVGLFLRQFGHNLTCPQNGGQPYLPEALGPCGGRPPPKWPFFLLWGWYQAHKLGPGQLAVVVILTGSV